MTTYEKLQERLPRILELIPLEMNQLEKLNLDFVEKGMIDTIYIDKFLKTSARGMLLKVALDSRLYGAQFAVNQNETKIEIPHDIDVFQNHILGVATPNYLPIRLQVNQFEQPSIDQLNQLLGHFYQWMSYHAKFIEQRYMMASHSTPRVLYYLLLKYPNIVSQVLQTGFENNRFDEKVESAIIEIVENHRFKCSMLETMQGIYKTRKEHV